MPRKPTPVSPEARARIVALARQRNPFVPYEKIAEAVGLPLTRVRGIIAEEGDVGGSASARRSAAAKSHTATGQINGALVAQRDLSMRLAHDAARFAKARPMSEAEKRALIDQHIREKGVTRCATAALEPINGGDGYAPEEQLRRRGIFGTGPLATRFT